MNVYKWKMRFRAQNLILYSNHLQQTQTRFKIQLLKNLTISTRCKTLQTHETKVKHNILESFFWSSKVLIVIWDFLSIFHVKAWHDTNLEP